MSDPLVDRTYFFANFPSGKLYGKALSPSRKKGFLAIFDVWDAIPEYDYPEWLAYALATAWHETVATMQPVREALKKTDQEAYEAVTAYCKKQGKSNYAARLGNGKSYYGRGYVQLTHAANYMNAGKRLGFGDALYADPDRVMDPEVAAKIMLTGMIEGMFRPKYGTLIDYFNSNEQRWFDARDLINGDKNKTPKWAGGKSTGEIIASYGRAFRDVIRLK
jgi:hypothetical protein